MRSSRLLSCYDRRGVKRPMKITRITTQKKGKRYNVFIDDGLNGDKYAFSVDEDILIKYHLRKDLDLDDETIRVITEQDHLHKHYNQVINYLSYRMRTEKEIHDYLVKKEVDPEQIRVIIEKLKAEKLINDEAFANMFVQSRIRTSLKGPDLIKNELRQKGVSDVMADKALHVFGYDDQYEKALKWIEKKGKQTSKQSYQKQLQQLQSTLRRNGFTQEVITHIIANQKDEKDQDTEWNALIQHGEKNLRKYQKKLSGYELRMKIKGALYRQGFTATLIDRFLDEYINEE